MTTRAAAGFKERPGLTVKQYKPLLSAAPANSILNAQQFHYTNSASTDIRKTFANFRRNTSRPSEASVALESLRRSPADRHDATSHKGR